MVKILCFKDEMHNTNFWVLKEASCFIEFKHDKFAKSACP